MKKSIFMVMLLCYSFCSWGGQEGVGSKQSQLKEQYLEGRVGDFFSKPISGAKVVVEGTKWQAQTNEQGQFERFGLTPGTYTIRVTHPQHKPLICKNFKIGKGGVYAGFMLKKGSPNDKPVIRDDRPLGQFVIDEDAEPIDKVEPVYPESALKDKTEGTVSLNVYVSETGEVLNAWVAQGVREDLNHAALGAIQNFKFKPAKVKGKPVSVPLTIPFNFKLADRSEGYPIDAVDDPIGEHQLNRILEILDVKLERFAYNVPFAHGFAFSFVEFADGKRTDRFIGGSIAKGNRAGKDTILMLVRKGPENTVKFEIHWANGAMITGPVTLKSYGATKVTSFPGVRLKENLKVPIFLYATNPRDLPNDRPTPTFEYYLKKYRFVIALFIELQPVS